MANIRDVDAQKFIWKNIITRFRTPHTLISDNGLQFDSKSFRERTDNIKTPLCERPWAREGVEDPSGLVDI